jgi:TonB family protein
MQAQVSVSRVDPPKVVPRRGPRQRTNPFVEKRAHHRQRSLARALQHVQVPLSRELRTARKARPMPAWQKGILGGLVLVLSVGLHVALVISAFGLGRLGAHAVKPREQLVIEVREVAPKEEPKPTPKAAEPEPTKPERVVAARQAPQPKIEIPQPKAQPKGPPPRVVGLTFESTTGTGGDGPAFAVGNTHQGETEKVAAAPKLVPKEVVNQGPTKVTPNKVATHVPMAGVTFTQPKVRKRVEPAYPSTLKTQGVEADVVVLVAIDAEGKVTKVQILKESPYPEFNQAARQAALADEFDPATRNGEPIPYSLKYTISFRLKDE